jgi:hypothetical protein
LKHKRLAQSNQQQNLNADVALGEDGIMKLCLELIAAYCALIGLWAGRCNVFMLVPLTGAALVPAGWVGAARGEGWEEIAIGMGVAAACLQAGYFASFAGPALVEQIARGARARVPVDGKAWGPAQVTKNAADGRRRFPKEAIRAD